MAGFSGIIDIDAAFTTAIDIFELKASASHPLTLFGFQFGQTTELGDAADEELVIALFRVSGAPTSGSGGVTVTSRGIDAQGMTATAVLEVGNTTALSGGTSEEIWRDTWKVIQPYYYQPVPGEQFSCGISEYLVLRFLGNPADSIGGTNGIAGHLRYFES